MRFLADGPSIPDELLIARDEGRVIFFCGAGVSRAYARLPDFFELAKTVMDSLGTLPESPSRSLIKVANAIEPIAGVGGVVSADRVFGLLAREFGTRDIEAAVAEALRPKSPADLSAHRILIELARGPDKKVRIVTTNFDLLFETSDRRLACWRPPNLPDPRRHNDFSGVIHLHGHVTPAYDGADGDGFVLSSAEFGRAYLSEAWATEFFRAVLDRYLVVFIGYAADDPPVQYLLEALNRTSPLGAERIFAFQSGSEHDAVARWRQKGVRAIAYSDANGHGPLWKTLNAWALRAKNPERWAQNIIRRAHLGPAALLPFERGQVVHLVSAAEGARRFADTKVPPPADWLCAFDPATRYAKPGKLNLWSGDGTYIDPFEDYGLDSDPVPEKIAPDDYNAKREIPPDVRDVFADVEDDSNHPHDVVGSSFRGRSAIGGQPLSSRLAYLGSWLARASSQPAAIWWAAGQYGLHRQVQRMIIAELRRANADHRAVARRAWRYLFESWSVDRNGIVDAFELKTEIDQSGWESATTRDYQRLLAPYITVSRPYWAGPKPPGGSTCARLRDVVNIDVEHPHAEISIQIPHERLKEVTSAVRENLERAVILEKEAGPFHLSHICPIEADPGLAGESSERSFGISRSVLFFVTLFKKLVEFDMSAAKAEFIRWQTNEDVVFAPLRIWATGIPGLLTGDEAGSVLLDISRDAFWNMRHQRDLLIVVTKRWSNFPQATRSSLEKRILLGPTRWHGRNKEQFAKHRAWAILDRLYWLHSRGCTFGFNLEKKAAPLRAILPQWKPEDAEQAAASREARGGFVQTDTSYVELLNEPLATTFESAMGKSDVKHEALIRHNPFSGLVSERPVRAISALRLASPQDERVAWGWQTFLYAQRRSEEPDRMSVLIAGRLLRLPESFLAKLSSAAASWLVRVEKRFCAVNKDLFWSVFDKVATSLAGISDGGGSQIVRHSAEPDWTTESVNSPAGDLAQVLLSDPSLVGLQVKAGLPKPWVNRARALIELGSDSGKYALVIFARQLSWLYAVDPDWTDRNLLKPIAANADSREPILAGFFLQPNINGLSLYSLLKPVLLELAVSPSAARMAAISHPRACAKLLLDGWRLRDEQTTSRWTKSDEMRRALVHGDDDFRAMTLWQVAHWSDITEKLAFLKEVWPRQMSARTPRTTERLCAIAFEDPENFPILVNSLVPLVSRVERGTLMLASLQQKKILERYPEKLLVLLWSVLPLDAELWPYGVADVLRGIEATEPSLKDDIRLITLKRRSARK